MKTTDKVATIIFRIIVGVIGLTVLAVVIKCKLYAKELTEFSAIGGFCGLMLGYAFGGDKWGLRLFSFFTGHPVPDKRLDDAKKSSKSLDKDVT